MKKITQISLAIAIMLSLGSVAAFAQPSVSAPTPPVRTTPKVISIFSDAYTNVTGTNFNPNWGQATVISTVQIAGNNTLKYAGLTYQGTEFPSVNALTMNKLHIDVWTADGTTLQITPISSGPKEKLIALTPLTKNAWNSYDLDLTQFTGVAMSDVFQFKIVGDGTIYIDNLYFYDNTATVDSEAPTAFTVTKGAVTSDAVELLLNATDNSGAVNYEITYGATKLTVGGVSGTQKSYSIAGLLGNTDYSFSVVAKDATGNIAINSPIVVTAKTASSIPAAPTPTRTAAHVISIYSDTYTNIANTNFFPGWGQATVATQALLAVGNSALKYANLNYQGTEFGSHVDASAMQKLHIDVYTENETSLQITAISPGKEFLVTLSPLNLNTWNGFDVALNSFTGVVLSDLFQFKFVGSGGKTVYIDNLYFHDGTTAVDKVNADKLVRIYPTVFTNQINVKSDSEISNVIVRNLVGQTIKMIQVSGLEKSIELNAISSGNYLVTVKLANGLLSTQKITKF